LSSAVSSKLDAACRDLLAPRADAAAFDDLADADAYAFAFALDLPVMKDSFIAYQWALRMHGFENAGRPDGAIDQCMAK
jgi:hypothetical protein